MNRQRALLSRVTYKAGRAGAIAVGGALLLASCSSHPATPTTTTSTTSTTTTVAPSTTTTAAAAPPCSTAVLRLAEDSAKSTAGAGSAYVAYTLTNTGPTPCSLNGFPTVTFFGPSGASGAGAGPKLSITTEHSGAAPSLVTVDAGAAGAFYLVVSDVPTNGVGCATVASIEVTPPGSTEALSAPSSLDPCGPSVGVTAIEPLASLST
ncbi:MAG: hypothetical protein JWO62_858 [Acidimicrobiaceae bacterium]|nr:hypothetical protein [Acidimicrobiaceae bacterium]